MGEQVVENTFLNAKSNPLAVSLSNKATSNPLATKK